MIITSFQIHEEDLRLTSRMFLPIRKLMNFVVAVSFDQHYPGGVPVVSGDGLQELCEIAPRIELTGGIFVVESRDPNEIGRAHV